LFYFLDVCHASSQKPVVLQTILPCLKVEVKLYPLLPESKSDPLADISYPKPKPYEHRYNMDDMKDLADFTIKVKKEGKLDTHVISCNKFILAKRSSVFQAMFEHSMKEKEDNFITISDFDVEVVQAMVSFMYDGTFETIKQMIRSKLKFPEQLLRIADKYDVSVLKETIELALIPLIEASNVTYLWIASDMCNSLPLKKAVVTFLVQNWKENDKFEGLPDIWVNQPWLVKDLLPHMAFKALGLRNTVSIVENAERNLLIEIFCCEY